VDARRAIPAAAGLTLTDLRASASTRDISSRTRSVGVLVHAVRPRDLLAWLEGIRLFRDSDRSRVTLIELPHANAHA